jgi:hypothetical protein
MLPRLALARLLDLLLVLFGVSVLVFLMIRLIPGDAVAIMLGANTEVTPERWRNSAPASASISPSCSNTSAGPARRSRATSAPRCGPAAPLPAKSSITSARPWS